MKSTAKLPKVLTRYESEVNMISFKDLETWEAVAFPGFQYDYITDEMIARALKYPKLQFIDIELDWEDDRFLRKDTSVNDEFKHAIRVAALVKHISAGGGVIPVEIDTFTVHNCCSCIANGHHRVRALQYLRYTHVPAVCSGYTDLLKMIIKKRVDKRIEFV